MQRSLPTARTRIDTPANTPPVNWRPWATRTLGIILRVKRAGWKQGSRWRRVLRVAPAMPLGDSAINERLAFAPTDRIRQDEDFVFASPTLKGKQPLWGQTMNAQFVKPAAIELELVAEGEHFGWHRFRHSLSTWANDTTKDIT